MRYQKAQMENYNPEIIAECGTEDEAVSLFDTYKDASSATEGYDIVYRDDAGVICSYDGDPVEMPTY